MVVMIVVIITVSSEGTEKGQRLICTMTTIFSSYVRFRFICLFDTLD